MTSESDAADDALIATRRELATLRQELAAARAAMQAQAEQEARLWSLFNLSSEGMLWVSPDSVILQANPAAARIYGREVAELIGQRWFELSDAHLHPDGSTAAPDEIRAYIRAARAAPISDYVMGLRRAGRDDVWVSLTTAPVFDAAGAHQYTLALLRNVTEKVLAEQARARAEEALRQSEERFRLLAERAQDTIYRVRVAPEQRFEYVSPAVVAWTGYTPQDLYRDASLAYETTAPEDRPRLIRMLRGELADGEPVVFHCFSRDGEPFWVEHRFATLRDAEGGVVLEGVARNITEQVRLQNIRLESQARLRALFEAMSEGLIVLGSDGVVQQANPAAARILRRPLEQMIGRPYLGWEDYQVFDAEGRSVSSPEFAAMMDRVRAGLTRDSLLGLGLPGGEMIWLQANGAPFAHADGQADAVILVFSDVTERVETERALRQSEGQLRLLFDTMSEGLLLVNAEGVVTAANPAAARILGAPREQLIGMFDAATQFELLKLDGSPYHHAEFAALYAEASNRAVRDVLAGLRRAEGDLAWINLSVAPLTGERDEFTGVVVVINDVTARVEAERELRQHRDQLESQVNARTLALRLANARLTSEIGERQRLEEDARRRERFLRQVLDAAPALIMVKDRQGRYVLVNQGTAEAYNVPIDEIEGHTLGEIGAAHHWDMADVQRYEAADQALLRGEIEQYISDLPTRRRDGSRRLFQLTKLPLRLNADPAAPGGEIDYLLTIGVDITAIRESEARYRTLFEASADAVLLETMDGRVLDANAAACALYGYDHDEMTGLTLADLLAPGEAGYAERMLSTELSRIGPGRVMARRRDGSAFPAEVHISAIVLGGAPHRLVRVHDIAERERAEAIAREAERAIRESEARYRTLVEASTDAILIEALDGQVLDCNAVACALYGYSKEEMLRLSIADIATPDTLERLPAYLPTLEREGFSGEFENRRKDGSVFPCDVSARPAMLRGERCVVAYVRDITARKRAGSVIRESEARYRTLVEASSDAIRIETLDGRILDCNAATCALYGYTKEELLATNARKLLTPETLERLRDYIPALEAGGFRAEFEDRRKDGSTFPCEVTTRPVTLQGERCTVVYVRDITARKRAEADIRDSELRYRTLFETSTDAIRITTMSGRILDCNAATCALYGYTKEELLNIDSRELLTPETLRRLRDYEPRRGIGGFSGEFEDRRKDGSAFPCEVNIKTVELRGEPCQVVYVRDITARKRAEAAILESEERYRTLFETSTDAILIEALDGRVLDCNAAACALYGYSKGEFLGLNVTHLMTAETRERVAGLAEQREREGFTGEFVDRRKDGSTFPNEVSVRPVAIGGERCVVVYIRDLTERRRLEDQLRQAQKMEAVGRLAGGVAHDFNNLLTVINGYSEMMLRSLPPSDPLHAELTEVHQAGERAADLTRRLLAFSRQQAVEPTVLRLNQVLDDMGKMLQRIIGEEMRLTTRLAPDLGRIRADRGQIEQLVINLCVNARDAIQERTREGGVVSIRTANITRGPGDVSPYLQAPAGRYVRLSVSDTGVGIGPEAAVHLFEPFYTTKEVGKGTGLGLAVVYGVVRDCGGAIEVESAPGQGATFHIDLPLVEETPAEGATGRARPHMPGGEETILIVEDQPEVRRLLASLLRRLGYTVVEAAGGAEALAACARPDLPIRLVITDVVMPEMSGPQFAARLRRARPDLRLLYISGYADDALRDQLAGPSEAGLPEIELIHKPFNFETLAAQVRRALG